MLGPHLGHTWATTQVRRRETPRDTARYQGGGNPKCPKGNHGRPVRRSRKAETGETGLNRIRKPVLYPLSYEGSFGG